MSQQPQRVRRIPAMRRVVDPSPPLETSDAELVHRVSLGDTAALEALYNRYARVVYSFAMRIVSDPMLAEEILQEVFVRTWRQADRFQRSRGNFGSWLLSITHNLSIDEIRKRQRRPQKSDAVDVTDALFGLVDDATNVEEAAQASALRLRIKTALLTLPDAQRDRPLNWRSLAACLNARSPLTSIYHSARSRRVCASVSTSCDWSWRPKSVS